MRFDTMTNNYNDEDFIQLRSTPPKVLFLKDGQALMRWEIEIAKQFEPNDLNNIASNISDGFTQIGLECGLRNRNLTMSVIIDPSITQHNILDLSIRSLLLLEKSLGAIVKIQGMPRDEWRTYFAITEQSGVLEKDKTHLMIAAEKGDIQTVRAILDSDFDINIDSTSPTGMTALIYAALHGHIEIVNLLLSRGASLHNDGECTLMQSAVMGGQNLVELLLDAGAEINARNKYGETALMYAVSWGKTSVVKLLLDRGADPNIKDNKEKAVLNWLSYLNPMHGEEQRRHVAELLKKAGAEEE
jgi:hypothetical protein